MAVRVLLVLAALVAFYGCGQSNPVPEQAEKKEKDFEQLPVREKTKVTPKPETTARVAPGYTPSEQTSADEAKAAAADVEATHDTQASASVSANAEFDRAQCRINNYVAEENMSKADIKSFTKDMIDYIIREEVEGGRDVTFEDFLDHEGVPAYGDLCGGG